MKFVADEGVDTPIVNRLREEGYDVKYILEEDPGIDDSSILQIANSENRILLTQDKDFGELVYRLKQIHTGVILVRLEGIKPKMKATIVLDAINLHQKELTNAFTVIQKGLIRIRK